MRPSVDGSDTDVVNHFDYDGDVFPSLKDLIIVVVGAGEHRWTRGGPQDAPFGQGPVFRAVSGVESGVNKCP